MKITGAQLIINALQEEKVENMFVYPGGYIIPILDLLHKQTSIRTILGRHEQAIVHQAEGYARSTGKTGVCLVSSGPGATNLVTGIADAYYDGVPLICFTGQVPRHLIGNDAFQEVDIVGITRSITKHSVMVTNRHDLGRIIKEAFYIANSGRPGPVLIDLPNDIIVELGESTYPKSVSIRSYKPSTKAHVGQVKRAVEAINNAKKPLFLVGNGIHIAKAENLFKELVTKTKIPTVTTIMGKGAISTNDELYIGNVGMHGSYASNMAISECDLLITIGARFSDRTTCKASSFAKNAKIIHIDIDTASISRSIKVDIPIVADAKNAINELLKYVTEKNTTLWLSQIKEWDKAQPLTMSKSDKLSPFEIINAINTEFPKSIIVTDVGQHQMWTTQFIELDQHRKLYTSGGLGTMGYGFPAALGAKLGNPNKQVICISGDGGFQMNMQEMATALIEKLPIITFIMNNRSLGMVKQMQHLFSNKCYASTTLSPEKIESDESCYIPDFVKIAESYGAIGYRVSTLEELVPVINKAKKETKRPVIIECLIDQNAIVYPMVKSGTGLDEMIMEEK